MADVLPALERLSSTTFGTLGDRLLPSAEVTFEDYEVPIESRFGEEGDGVGATLRAIQASHGSVATHTIGISQPAIDAAVAYAKARHQFGRPIEGFRLIQEMLADRIAETDAARLLVYRAAGTLPLQAASGPLRGGRRKLAPDDWPGGGINDALGAVLLVPCPPARFEYGLHVGYALGLRGPKSDACAVLDQLVPKATFPGDAEGETLTPGRGGHAPARARATGTPAACQPRRRPASGAARSAPRARRRAALRLAASRRP